MLNFKLLHRVVTHFKKFNDMNRKKLTGARATKTGSTKADSERNIVALLEIITATLKEGRQHRITQLIGFLSSRQACFYLQPDSECKQLLC